MDESRMVDALAISQATARRIPVRSISLAIMVAVVLYVGMVTHADWKSLRNAVLVLPDVL